jgi:hypothetical protein
VRAKRKAGHIDPPLVTPSSTIAVSVYLPALVRFLEPYRERERLALAVR